MGTYRGRHITLLLAIYAVSVVFVCSFILFEVLDVDGSDFPPPTRALRLVTPVETPHDLKRGVVQGLMPLTVPIALRLPEKTHDPAPGARVAAERSAHGAGDTRNFLVLLPRASIPDFFSAA